MSNTMEIRTQELSWDDSMKILDALPGMALGERAEAVEKLFRNPSPGIRQRALSIGATVLSDNNIEKFIRNEADDVIRNAGLEILKLKGKRSFSLIVALLKDHEPDVILQAILVLDHLRDPRAFNSLRALLKHENPNVVQAAITAIGHLGDARAIPELLPFLKADPWLQMASIQALGDIRSPIAVKPLKRLLPDFLLGPFVAEALALIGGSQAFLALSEHWVYFHAELEAEPMLGFLAYILEGLSKKPKVTPAFFEALSSYLHDRSEPVRAATARCFLVLGPSQHDEQAIYVLADSYHNLPELPVCLIRRRDLIPVLLAMEGLPCIWGIQLTARYPKEARVSDIITALSRDEVLEHINVVMPCLRKKKDKLLAPALIELYLRLPLASRPSVISLLMMYKKNLDMESEQWAHLDKETRLILSASLGNDTDTVVREMQSLSSESQISVISQIYGQKAICKKLPWNKWLLESPSTYGTIAAQVAMKAQLYELIPILRNVLQVYISPDIIRALGELGDRESVPIFVDYLNKAHSFIKALIIENLGHIGGPEARKALKNTIMHAEGKEASLAYRAFSQCAIEEDTPFFLKAISHTDWIIRLACVEVLGRFQKADNLDALTRLAADPVPAIAQRAMFFLEPGQ
jgi:HEAT repeat protein